jgi:putative membrane protein
MQRLLDAFLSSADRRKVVAAVRAAETRTSAEIVPMVIGASDSYPKADLACAVAVGLTAGVLLNLALGGRGMWLFLIVFGIASLAAFEAAKRLPGLKRLFVSRDRALHETRQASQAAFFTHGLTKTRQRNAVLIYVSIFERLVFIQTDIGLTGKLDQASLDAATAVLTAGIRQGRPAAALVSTIEALAGQLAPHFPPREDDTNEIKDLIIF